MRPSSRRTLPPKAPHAVQFYESSEFLVDSVSRFARKALAAGDGFLLVADPTHQSGIESRLVAAGLDPSDLASRGRYRALDAAKTLDQFSVARRPRRDRFRSVLGPALAGLAGGKSGRISAFGEMVALLYGSDRKKEALELERLWNEILVEHPLSLLCGYPIGSFRSREDGSRFAEICSEHSRVVPTESFDGLAGRSDRGRAIAVLQQKAARLETETGRREKVEQALGRTEKELADFLEHAAEGLHQVGPDGTILWANKAELDLLGYSAEEYIGHHIDEFHADQDAIARIMVKLLAGDTLYDEPSILRRKDGELRHVRIYSNSLWENGKFVHSRCFTRDVTDRVHLEERLRDKIEELAEADRRKDEFLAMLGHELRNPLSPIVTAVELMRVRGDDPDLVARSIGVIERQTRRMTRLVDDLLDVSRITRGKIALKREAVSLTSLVERAVEQVRPLIEERGHRLTLDLPREPVTLLVDPTRLEQVLANLLINAAKYTEIGGRIELSARRAGREVEIAVRDDGIGLDAGMKERIFDLFVQAPGSGRGSRAGLGVGLTLVRRLVELHEGRVEVSSDGLGRGCEFRVRLPLPRQKAADRANETARPGKAANPSTTSSVRRILVVDDNVEAADGLAELLRSLGHDVRVRNGGAGAVEEALESVPEVVFLDIGMPDVDGHEVARRLRNEPRLRACVLVALTGFGQEADRRSSREAGFDHHLVKPVDISAVETLLQPPS